MYAVKRNRDGFYLSGSHGKKKTWAKDKPVMYSTCGAAKTAAYHQSTECSVVEMSVVPAKATCSTPSLKMSKVVGPLPTTNLAVPGLVLDGQLDLQVVKLVKELVRQQLDEYNDDFEDCVREVVNGMDFDVTADVEDAVANLDMSDYFDLRDEVRDAIDEMDLGERIQARDFDWECNDLLNMFKYLMRRAAAE